jgi:Cu(I)/Ag(I) efflux system membrane fusion protein
MITLNRTMKKITATFLAIAAAVSTSFAHEHATTPLQTILVEYVKIQQALAGDSLNGVPEAATAIVTAIKGNEGELPGTAVSQAEVVGKATDIKAARAAFKPLSVTLIGAASSLKKKTGHFYEAYCPMAGAAWIQADKKVANPYYGASMLTCGEIRRDL